MNTLLLSDFELVNMFEVGARPKKIYL